MIISASPIPGNENAVYTTQNELVRLGARVFHSGIQKVHVHGHGRRDDLRSVINLTNPRYMVPVHGEYRMLATHAELAVDQGVDEDNAFVVTDGEVLELDWDGGRIVDKVDAGNIFVDGLGLWDERVNVIDERRQLAEDGVVHVIIPRNASTGRILGPPQIVSKGFVSSDDAIQLFSDTLDELQGRLDQVKSQKLEWERLQATVKGTVEKFLHKRTRRRPLVVPVAVDV